MEEVLKRCLEELQSIQNGRKGSIGSLDNVYLPQLNRKRIDVLVHDIKVELKQIGPAKELTVAVHNCNDNMVGEFSYYFCGICGKPL